MPTYFKQALPGGGIANADGRVPESINSLLTSGKYRDIPGGVLQNYMSGNKSEEETIAAITGTPIFNQAQFDANLKATGQGGTFDYGQGKTQYDPSKIMSVNLAPTTPVSYASPSPTPIVPASSVSPAPVDTTGNAPVQTDLDKRINELMAMVDDGTGRASFQVQQEQAQDIGGKMKLVNDLTAQLNAIKAEATGITLAPAGVNQTAGMLGAQQRELLAQNSLKALTIGVALEAAKGNLTLAQYYADKAVEQKYGAMEASIKAKLQNLELLSKRSDITAAEQKRADARTLALKKAEDEITNGKSNTTAIMSILSDPEFQLNAPASVKKQISDLAQKINLTQADVILANNLGARYKVSPKVGGGGGTPTDIKAENYDRVKQEAITLFEADKARNADKKISPDLYQAIRDKIPSTLKDNFDKWARDAGYLSPETQKKFGILDAKSDIGSVLNAFLQSQTPKEE